MNRRWMMSRGSCDSVFFTAVVLSILLTVPAPGSAEIYDVTMTEDIVHGFCDPVIHGCSLRDAVLAANAHPFVDEIRIPPGTYVLTIPGIGEDAGLTGDLDVTEAVHIFGSGAEVTVIDAQGLDRVLEIVDGVSGGTEIVGLTFRGGDSSSDPISTHGAGVSLGNDATSIWYCIFEENTTTSGHGGGLFLEGDWVEFFGCTFRSNTAQGGSAIAAYLGGAFIGWSSIVDNYATDLYSVGTGGAVWAYGSFIKVHNSTVAGNRTRLADQPAGVFVQDGLPTIINSTIADNHSVDVLYVQQPGPTVFPMTIRNSVIRGTCSGTFSSEGGNVEGPGDSCGLDVETDLIGVDVLLSPLGHYGGEARALSMPPEPVPGNVIIDNALADPNCYQSDQRWFTRHFDGDGDGMAVCDSGAVEYQGWIFGDGFKSGDTVRWSSTAP